VLLGYIERMTGLSRQQVTRLVRQYRKNGKLAKRQDMAPKRGFTRSFTVADVALLAEVDTLHNTLSGPATKKLMERALLVFGDVRFERLAGISVSHLYNLRGGKQYQNKRRHWTRTNPTGVPVGQRRAPQPNGMPGYIRIDSVHQGDQDGVKGVFHINAVDCVTQMQFVATCEKPVLSLPKGSARRTCARLIGQLLDGFPFVIYLRTAHRINHKVAKLLKKLLVEFTKSRSRQSNDNAGCVKERFSGAQTLGLREYPATLRQFGYRLLCRPPQPLRQLPSPRLLPGNDH